MTSTPHTLLLSALALFIVTAEAGGASASGLAALERGDYATAQEILEPQVAADPDNIELRIALGRTLMARGNAKAAAGEFEKAIAATPNNADAHYWYGAANGTLAGNANVFSAGPLAKKARTGFEKALELNSKHVDALKGMVTYYLNAPRLFGGDEQKALDLIGRLTEIDSLEGKLTLADYYDDVDEQDKALQAAQQAAREHPDDPRAHLRLGFMTQEAQNFAAALAHFQRGAAGKASDSDTRRARQGALYQIGRTAVFGKFEFATGIDALSEYIGLEIMGGLPSKEWATYRLGLLHQLNDNNEQAESLFRQALASTDDNDLKRQIRQRL